jgi:hypothetical protein
MRDERTSLIIHRISLLSTCAESIKYIIVQAMVCRRLYTPTFGILQKYYQALNLLS